MRTSSKKSPQIYLSISESDTKAKLSKKSKKTKIYTVKHVIHIYTMSNFTSPDFSIII